VTSESFHFYTYSWKHRFVSWAAIPKIPLSTFTLIGQFNP